MEARAEILVRTFLDCDPATDLELGVNYKQVKPSSSLQSRLEYCFSRRTTTKVQDKLKEKSRDEERQDEGSRDFAPLLSFQNHLFQDNVTYFTKASLNLQGQLSLGLNRLITFTEAISKVAVDGVSYGHQSSSLRNSSVVEKNRSVVFLNDASVLRQAGCVTPGCDSSGGRCNVKDTTDVLVEEGRIALLIELLSNLLRANSRAVHNLPPSLSRIRDTLMRDPLPPPSTSGTPSSLSQTPWSDEVALSHFISTLAPPTGGMEAVPEPREVNTEEFLMERQGSYDGNIRNIQVSNSEGVLSPPTHLAYEACRIAYSAVDKDHVICHVTPSNKSFIVQQAMILDEMYRNRSSSVSSSAPSSVPSQSVLLLSGGVECVKSEGRKRGGGRGRGRGDGDRVITFSDLIRTRRRQMAEVYAIKYGPRATQDKEFQELICTMTEAVVKFELLSHDHHTLVRVVVPSEGEEGGGEGGEERGGGGGGGVETGRFPGAFVLYNYARLATILKRHQQLFDEGLYPSLPSVDQVDFSLLNDEMEWQLLFNYIMRFPSVVHESSLITRKKKKTERVGVEAQTKKVCLFLISLSHLVSAYYSKVKILMSPEPHLLPLIHARLHLVSALKQIMFNGLALMNIKPLDEL